MKSNIKNIASVNKLLSFSVIIFTIVLAQFVGIGKASAGNPTMVINGPDPVTVTVGDVVTLSNINGIDVTATLSDPGDTFIHPSFNPSGVFSISPGTVDTSSPGTRTVTYSIFEYRPSSIFEGAYDIAGLSSITRTFNVIPVAVVTHNIINVSTLADITVSNGTAFSSLVLPSNVMVTLDDNSTVTLPVIWSSYTYNGNVDGSYDLTGDIDLSGTTNITNIEPTKTAAIRVIVRTANINERNPIIVVNGPNPLFLHVSDSDGLYSPSTINGVDVTAIPQNPDDTLSVITVTGCNSSIVGCDTENPGKLHTNVPDAAALMFTVYEYDGDSNVVVGTASVIRHYLIQQRVSDDETAPTITLNGSSTITIDHGQNFIDPSATATTTAIDHILSSIVITGAPNSESPVGTYIVVYTVTDTTNGLTASTTRTVIVSSGDNNDDDNNDGDNNNNNGSSFSSGGSSSSFFKSLPVIVADSNSCPLLKTYMKLGLNNDSSEVLKLQAFLKAFVGSNVDITGIFDQKTDAGVKSFQEKYLTDTMGPWGASIPSGYVYITTLKKINQLVCKSPLTLSASDQALIQAFKDRKSTSTPATSTVDVIEQGSTNSGENASTSNEIGQNSNTNSNTAAAANASLIQKFWDFLVNLF